MQRASPVGYGTIDIVKDELTYSSGYAEALLGYTDEELKAYSKNYFESIVHPDDIRKSRAAIKRLLNGEVGEIIECTLRVRKSDNSYLTLFIRDIVFARDAQNAPIKFATVVQDVTEIAELERKLDESLDTIRKISYKNSHELRAPVANIIGLVALMKEQNFKTEYNAKIFHHLEETVKRLDNIIHDINNMADGQIN